FYVIVCLDTILVYNTYFNRYHDHLKHVLHVLGKESLVFDLNKYMACTYDTVILVSVLSVQNKQVQHKRSVMDERRYYAYQPEIWIWKYLRKMASKLQGSFCRNPSFDIALNRLCRRARDCELYTHKQ